MMEEPNQLGVMHKGCYQYLAEYIEGAVRQSVSIFNTSVQVCGPAGFKVNLAQLLCPHFDMEYTA